MQDMTDTSNSVEALAFKLGSEEYGINILKVQEIRGYDAVTRIANSPEFIKGVINLRGIIVPIVDMRIKKTNRSERLMPTLKSDFFDRSIETSEPTRLAAFLASASVWPTTVTSLTSLPTLMRAFQVEEAAMVFS